MGVRNPNSTGYVHPDEPNLLNLHKAMEYDEAGKPHVRVTLGSDTITINGDVNLVEKVKLWDGTDNLVFDMPNNDGETAPISLPTESHNMVFNGSTWDRMRGTINDGVLVKFTNTSIGTTFTNTSIGVTQGTTPWQISKDANANSDSNRIFVNSSGTVELGATTLSALENITVSGTVELGTTTLSALENINATVSGTVALDTATLSALENISATVSGTVALDTATLSALENISATVSGTVELGSTTLSALENINAVISDGGGSITVDGSVTATVTGGTFTNPDLEFTSKNRLKISPYATVFFNTFQYGKESDVWDESTTGSASATHNSLTNGVDMRVNGTQGSKVVRQTRNVMRYIPGRTSTLTYAVRLQTPLTGIRRRFGLFQENDGFYFEDAGVIGADGLPEYNVVVRSSITGVVLENRVPRSQWNGDHLDGTGNPVTNPSGILADATTQQLVNFEYEWYGAGQVIVGFCINGRTHVIHTFSHGNNITIPWCSTPFLPIRLELENLNGVAGAHYLYQGSNSLISEGVAEKLGIAANITSPIAGTNLATKGSWYPVLSIRMKSTALRGIVLPAFFQVATLDNTILFYRLVRNATIGTGGGGWTDHPDPDSFTQYQTYTNPSAITDINQGTSIDSGFVAGGGGGTGIRLDKDTVYQLGRTSMGTVSDTLTILCSAGLTNKDAVAAFTWIEQR